MTAVSSARRRWRLAAIVLTLAALLLVAAYVAITTAYPPARLAAMLGEQVKAATGRDFRVNGALSIRLLPSLPIRLALQVGRLNLPGVPPLSAVEARLTCEPGRFVIEPLSFGAAGGQLRGRVEITIREGAPPKTVLRLDARDLSVEALDALKGPGGHFHGGRADLKASLALAGTTPRQLAASASGELLLSVSRTALAGKAGVLERNVLATLLQALLPGRAAHQALTIDCAVVRLPLQRGVATIDRSIAMETDQLAVSASGNVNLATQTMTLAFRPKVKNGLGLNPSSLVHGVPVPARCAHRGVQGRVGDGGPDDFARCVEPRGPGGRRPETALSDFYPEYRLVCRAIPSEPRPRALVLSSLHASIQDMVNEYGVQIMSPHYFRDPPESKLVPQDRWLTPPAWPPQP